MSATAPISTIAENATDALHSVGSRLTLPDDVADGIVALSDAITPTTTLAVGAGTRAAISGGRTVRSHPLLVAGGVLVAIGAFAWFVTHRNASDSTVEPGADAAPGTRSAA